MSAPKKDQSAPTKKLEAERAKADKPEPVSTAGTSEAYADPDEPLIGEP